MPTTTARERRDNRERQATFQNKMRERGFVRRTIWIPARDADRLKAYVSRLVRKYDASTK